MVSFTCETCNDVLKKGKVDSHCRVCRSAWKFTCVDCHTCFEGFDYQSHTQCISEAEKVQGKLFKPKSAKQRQPGEREEAVEVAWMGDWENTICAILKRQKSGRMPWKDLRDQAVALRIRAYPEDAKRRKLIQEECLCNVPERFLSSQDRFVRETE